MTSTGLILFKLFESAAERDPNRLAMVSDGDAISYRALHRNVREFSGSLSRVLGADDRGVELCTHTPHGTAVALFGCWAVGCCAVVGAREHGELDAVAGTGVRVTEPLESDVGLQVSRLALPVDERLSTLPPGCALVLPTSGTSGPPKRVCHTASSLLRGLGGTIALQAEALGQEAVDTSREIDHVVSEIERLQLSPLDLVFATTMPLETIAGLTLLLRSVLLGEGLVARSRFSVVALRRDQRRWPVTNISMNPFMVEQILREVQKSRWPELASVLGIGVGGGPASPRALEQLERATGTMVFAGYGSTELGGPAIVGRYQDPPDLRWRTVGRALPNVHLSVESPGVGNLTIQSPSQMTCYLGAGQDCPTAITTGDLARIRDDGYVTIVGRDSDFILRGGRRINPYPIEEAVRQVPEIDDVVVVGIQGRIAGEEDVVLVVQTRSSAQQSAARIRNACSRLPPPQQPRRIEYVQELPRTADGAVMRGQLKQQLGSPTP